MTLKPRDAYINTTAEYQRISTELWDRIQSQGGRNGELLCWRRPVAIHLTGRPFVELVHKFHTALRASHTTFEITNFNSVF
jgi:hypothetical protein